MIPDSNLDLLLHDVLAARPLYVRMPKFDPNIPDTVRLSGLRAFELVRRTWAVPEAPPTHLKLHRLRNPKLSGSHHPHHPHHPPHPFRSTGRVPPMDV